MVETLNGSLFKWFFFLNGSLFKWWCSVLNIVIDKTDYARKKLKFYFFAFIATLFLSVSINNSKYPSLCATSNNLTFSA